MRIGLFIFPVRFANLPPIDLASLSAYLKGRGHEVFAHDFNVELPIENDCDEAFWSRPGSQRALLARHEPLIEGWVESILDFAPDTVGISVWATQLAFSLHMARRLKRRDKDIQVVFGGPWCSYFSRNPSIFMKEGTVDAVVFGEGEQTLAELVETGSSQGPIAGSQRLVSGSLVAGPRREENIPLDSLPFPDFSPFDFNRYLYKDRCPILFTRGCNWDCSFCSHKKVWRSFRARSAEHILAEMEHRLTQYPGLRSFQSCDHAMNADMGQFLRLCDMLSERRLSLRGLSGFARIDRQMLQEATLARMRRVPFETLFFGIQSGSDRVLKSMRRPYTAAEAAQVLEGLHRIGIRASIDFISGYPTETEEDSQLTLSFITQVKDFVENMSLRPHCHVGANDLSDHPERYGIHTLNSGLNNWASAANTPDIRRQRYERAVAHLAALGASPQEVESSRG